MRLLLDHCVPQRFGRLLTGHECRNASEMEWDRLRNGKLLTAAAAGGFDAVITVDQNLKHQQNLAMLPLSVVVLRTVSNDMGELAKLVPMLLAALEALPARQLVEVPPST